MNSIYKYFILSAAIILVVGSVIGIIANQKLFLVALNNNRFLPTMIFILLMYLVILIVVIRAINSKSYPLIIFSVLFAIQIPVAVSSPLIFEFNTGIAFNVLLSNDNVINEFWNFGSKGILFFNTEVSPNSYGINIVALLYFIGLIFIFFKKRPTKKSKKYPFSP